MGGFGGFWGVLGGLRGFGGLGRVLRKTSADEVVVLLHPK